MNWTGNDLKVAIIGLGRIGKVIAKLLMKYEKISEIMIYSTHNHEGYIEELQHINAYHIKLTVAQNIKELRDADYFMVSASVDYSELVKGKLIDDEWKIELLYNKKIITDSIAQLKDVTDKRFIIYTNPVDVICNIVYRQLNKKNEMYGFGSNLDTIRLRNLKRNNGYMIGEHGISMVPVGVTENIDEMIKIREYLIKSVSKVTTNEGFTLIGPEAAMISLFDALFEDKGIEIPLSIYHGEEESFYGWLVAIKAGQIEKEQISLNCNEKELLKRSIEKIKRSDKEI